MAPEVEAEVEALKGMSAELITIVASQLNITNTDNASVDLIEKEPVVPLLWHEAIRFEASFLVTLGEEKAVVKFPLFSRTPADMIAEKISVEVVTLTWVKQHTSLPVPQVKGIDWSGTLPWNTTHRPLLILEHLPGKFITDNVWRGMTDTEKHRVAAHIARVTAELSFHSFDKIGSLHPYDANYRAHVGPLVSYSIAYYCLQYKNQPKLARKFRNCCRTYSSTLEYVIALANLRLLQESIVSPGITDKYVEAWIFRSIAPALILDDFSKGPFVLRHGNLDRTALLWDENFELTGVINWEWSHTEPLQFAAHFPELLGNLPMDLNDLLLASLRGTYIEMLQKWEEHIRKVREDKSKVPPVINGLALKGNLLAKVGYVIEKSGVDVSLVLWNRVFLEIFGQMEPNELLDIYRSAPGVINEFKRMRNFVEAAQVPSIHAQLIGRLLEWKWE